MVRRTTRCQWSFAARSISESISRHLGRLCARHNHRWIGEAIRGRRRRCGHPLEERQPTRRQLGRCARGRRSALPASNLRAELKNLEIETLDVFCMSRVDPSVPIEESVGGMTELVKEGKTRFISLSECSANSLVRGSAVHRSSRCRWSIRCFRVTRKSKARWTPARNLAWQ